MTGVTQAVFMNQRSFGVVIGGLVIGQAYQGGFFAGQISTAGNGVADFNLVIAPKSTGEDSSIEWKTSNTSDAGAGSDIDGPTNSSNINDASHPAAQFCEGLSIGGYSDWYMPAKNELEVCYYYFKSTTASNYTSSGINTNAVPSRGSNYTSDTPARTTASDFISGGGSEAFGPGYYWSSTERFAASAWYQYFAVSTQTNVNGLQNDFGKNINLYVRAVRRVAV